MTRARLHLYTRIGCHLCDEMLAAARPIARRHGIAIEKIDIDSDPQLRRRYGLAIPVLALGGEEICRHRLDVATLERVLARPSSDDAR